MNDINEQKKSMRSSFILLRSQISDKSKKDDAVFRRLISLDSICSADTVLSYISVETETDTLKIIDYLLSNGIKVAAPRCKKNGIMDFFYISSLNETIAGKYGIPEPVGNEKAAVTKNTANNVVSAALIICLYLLFTLLNVIFRIFTSLL